MDKKDYVEVWGDHVKMKDLMLSMLLCILFSLGGYVIAPGEAPQPLIIGLIGGVVGFIVSSIIIKPKRIITKEKGEE